MKNRQLARIIAQNALGYYKNYNPDVLFEMLIEEWTLVESSRVATRGQLADYLRGVVLRIARKIVKNKDVFAVSMETIAVAVMEFAKRNGYDVGTFSIPLSLLTGLVANAMVEQLGVMIEPDQGED